ncbi:MAG TPA: ATP-binding protein, partial [Chloroflexota bacterium]|nr:ATP-binding protein [Chloroflexota bacterium]
VVGLILLVLGSAVYVAMSRSLLEQVDRNLGSRAEEAANNPRAFLSGQGDFDRERYRGGVFYIAVDDDGRVLANPQHVDPSELNLRLTIESVRRPRTERFGEDSVRLYARRLEHLGSPPPGRVGKPGGPANGPGTQPPQMIQPTVLIIGQSLASEERALGSLVLVLIAGGAAGLVLSFAGAWFLAGRALIPIEQAFRRQQEFVADASHELRTPITVLRSATDLLNQHRAEPLAANADLFDDIRHEITRLQRLTGDLLTLARSDRGQLEIAVAPLDLGLLVADVVRRTVPLATENGIELVYRRDAPGLDVEGDPDRLDQVLLILIDNALKHTPSGGRVEVIARQQKLDAIIEVVDNGSGISAEHLPRIFERFYRVDSARSRAQGGTGLGLAIAKTVVDAHGGELSLTSEHGAGTRAIIRLPIRSSRSSASSGTGNVASSSGRRP